MYKENLPHVVGFDDHFGRNFFNLFRTVDAETSSDPSNKQHFIIRVTRELTSQWSKCKHVAKDAPRSRRSGGKCAVPAAAAAVPRGMRRRVIYDPPAAPSPLTPLARQRRVLDVGTNRCEETRQVYGQRFEGVVRCVMQACVLCARWTCNDERWQLSTASYSLT